MTTATAYTTIYDIEDNLFSNVENNLSVDQLDFVLSEWFDLTNKKVKPVIDTLVEKLNRGEYTGDEEAYLGITISARHVKQTWEVA